MKSHLLPTVNSHNSWSRLEEVWLGDVYPSSWYSHLAPQVRDVFHQLTEITKHDLDKIHRTLELLGITVQRPKYDHIDKFIDHNNQLIKPQICPRDHFVVIDNKLIGHEWQFPAWEHLLDRYRSDSRCSVNMICEPGINGANVVRVGRDIIIDVMGDFVYNDQFPEYRVQLVNNGGHLDGCFAILKPGLILANRYFDDYDRTFPGWDIIFLNNPTYCKPQQRNTPLRNGKFFDTTFGANQMFNEHVVQHALQWVGNYTETYFELNCLVIDEHNVVMLAENEALAHALDRHGITVHWVPFRTRSFWDGGVHCLTVDIRRQSKIEDFFPERG
jgi:hypothetical protein